MFSQRAERFLVLFCSLLYFIFVFNLMTGVSAPVPYWGETILSFVEVVVL